MTIPDADYLDLSNTAGIIATGVVSFNLLLGMMMSTRYRNFPIWKRYEKITRHINVLKTHTYTAYTGFGLVVVHVVLLLMAKSSGFTIWNSLYPVIAPHQPLLVSLGTLSFIALILVAFTSVKIARKALHFKIWKRIHFTAYAVVFLYLIHGILIDQSLHDNPPDPFDGEKMVSDISLLLLVIGAGFRLRYSLRHRHLKSEYEIF
jgi:DMSO/TMAO reductase YedYZ heme-binding membrane subunit